MLTSGELELVGWILVGVDGVVPDVGCLVVGLRGVLLVVGTSDRDALYVPPNVRRTGLDVTVPDLLTVTWLASLRTHLVLTGLLVARPVTAPKHSLWLY